MSYLEKNELTLPFSSAELKSEITANTGLKLPTTSRREWTTAAKLAERVGLSPNNPVSPKTLQNKAFRNTRRMPCTTLVYHGLRDMRRVMAVIHRKAEEANATSRQMSWNKGR